MLATAVRSRLWLGLAGAGLVAAIAACSLTCGTAQEPEIICVVPDITLRQQYATPPPQQQPLEHRSVTATLISRGATMPGCGTFMVETTMVFADILADNATLNVRVPCAEMARAMYSQTAGNAPVLHEQMPYRLELSGRGGMWHADRIDLSPPLRADPYHDVFCRNIAEPGCGLPLRRESIRPAIADRMCHDVWGPNCGPRP